MPISPKQARQERGSVDHDAKESHYKAIDELLRREPNDNQEWHYDVSEIAAVLVNYIAAVYRQHGWQVRLGDHPDQDLVTGRRRALVFSEYARSGS